MASLEGFWFSCFSLIILSQSTLLVVCQFFLLTGPLCILWVPVLSIYGIIECVNVCMFLVLCLWLFFLDACLFYRRDRKSEELDRKGGRNWEQ